MNRPNILAAAMFFHRQGWSMYPTSPRSKSPYWELLPIGVKRDGTRGPVWSPFQKRQPTAQEVFAWFSISTDGNLALITGAVSNLVIIEFDEEDAIGEFCDFVGIESLFDLATPIVRSRRGYHCYFEHPGFEVRGGIGLACEVKGDGLSCTAPPSIHQTGHLYKFEITPRDAALQPLPPVVVERLQANRVSELPVAPMPRHHFDMGSAYGRKALQNACSELAVAAAGDKHKMLVAKAFNMGRLIAAGAMDQVTATAALEYQAQQIGFTPSEAHRVVYDGVIAGLSHPAHIENARHSALMPPRRARTLDQLRKNAQGGKF